MITNTEIEGFRSFRRLSVNGLTLVNLFVGANNAGKTSILEAIELLAIGTPPALWRSPVRRGEELTITGEEERPSNRPELDISHLFFGHSLEGASFSITASGKHRRF